LILDSKNLTINLASVGRYTTPQRKKSLLSFFEELDLADENINRKIEDLFSEFAKIPDLLDRLRSSSNKDPADFEFINKISSLLSSLGRIEKVMEVYRWNEEKKKSVTEEWDRYIAALTSFMPDKEFRFDNGGEFTAKSGKKVLKMDELSSGEKQVFYMLTKTYLESGEDHIFLADEPELSLHIEWQEKILESMVSLNRAGQYLVATHSPEIASSFADNITAVEEIFRWQA